jgi:thiamine pyrophosphokinase
MRSCLIITGGKMDLDFAKKYLADQKEPFTKVIAVDGGLAAADVLGIIPDYIVGDFDTIDPAYLEKYRQYPYIVWDAHKPEKNETDTELARSRALTLSCQKIVFLGATGGRMDHMLGNLHALYECMKSGKEAYIVDRQNRVCLIDGETAFSKKEQWGKYVSFLPYTEEVTDITLKGFKYPLDHRTIRRGEEVGLCVSNEIVEDEAVIDFTDGVLICVESCD